MKNNFIKSSTVVTTIILIIVIVLIYLLIPKNFWDSVGKENYKSAAHTSVKTEGGPTPAILQFRDPFKYDKYEPTKKDEFLKKREENSKNSENKPLFWK